MSHMSDVIDISMSTFGTMPSALTIGGGVVNEGCVITKTFLGMIVLVEFFYNLIIT
jgi:hypothetical protein